MIALSVSLLPFVWMTSPMGSRFFFLFVDNSIVSSGRFEPGYFR